MPLDGTMGSIITVYSRDWSDWDRPEWVIRWDDPSGEVVDEEWNGTAPRFHEYGLVTKASHMGPGPTRFPVDTKLGDRVIWRNGQIHHFNGPPCEPALVKNLNSVKEGPDGKLWTVFQARKGAKCRWVRHFGP